ncbi:hypothetical protein [Aureimonas jatrophae]|uniref:Uncharacterized protein n=1 Tax=Aureimonas jatrophae TaxID=1166073 RepID=A0A1H0GZX1_9HYPH|nr:hypothetical protein [Aureimonas jatrophae]MBB3949894.1 hypothetical protein [Aureimonas jatrophae]SDO12334.1 hypothetical protein SAMN05192530_103441 [Aureimonas jatrophae]
MTKRDLILIIGAMFCFTAAIAALIVMSGESSRRSERNIELICAQLQEINGKPCQLLQPSETEARIFAFSRRR